MLCFFLLLFLMKCIIFFFDSLHLFFLIDEFLYFSLLLLFHPTDDAHFLLEQSRFVFAEGGWCGRRLNGRGTTARDHRAIEERASRTNGWLAMVRFEARHATDITQLLRRLVIVRWVHEFWKDSRSARWLRLLVLWVLSSDRVLVIPEFWTSYFSWCCTVVLFCSRGVHGESAPSGLNLTAYIGVPGGLLTQIECSLEVVLRLAVSFHRMVVEAVAANRHAVRRRPLLHALFHPNDIVALLNDHIPSIKTPLIQRIVSEVN